MLVLTTVPNRSEGDSYFQLKEFVEFLVLITNGKPYTLLMAKRGAPLDDSGALFVF